MSKPKKAKTAEERLLELAYPEDPAQALSEESKQARLEHHLKYGEQPTAPELTPEEIKDLELQGSLGLVRSLIAGTVARGERLGYPVERLRMGDGESQEDDLPGPIKNLRMALWELEAAEGSVDFGDMHMALQLAVFGVVDGMTADYRLLQQEADARIERLETEKANAHSRPQQSGEQAAALRRRLDEIEIELRLTREESDRYQKAAQRSETTATELRREQESRASVNRRNAARRGYRERNVKDHYLAAAEGEANSACSDMEIVAIAHTKMANDAALYRAAQTGDLAAEVKFRAVAPEHFAHLLDGKWIEGVPENWDTWLYDYYRQDYERKS